MCKRFLERAREYCEVAVRLSTRFSRPQSRQSWLSPERLSCGHPINARLTLIVRKRLLPSNGKGH